MLVGCLLHLILTRGSYEWGLELVKTLWSQGEALKSGGVVSGLIALGLDVYKRQALCGCRTLLRSVECRPAR